MVELDLADRHAMALLKTEPLQRAAFDSAEFSSARGAGCHADIAQPMRHSKFPANLATQLVRA